MRRTIALAACVVLMGVGCTEDDPAPELRGQASPEPTVAALVASLPDECGVPGEQGPNGAITFAKDGRLYSTTPDGSVTCLREELRAADELTWNGAGERALLGNDDGASVVGADEKVFHVGLNSAVSFSRPTGTAVLAISENRKRLTKTPLSGNGLAAQDIGFLRYTDAAAYHPAGTHLAVSGLASDDTYGVWLATNLGTEPKLLARGESFDDPYDPSEPRITEIAWSHRGDVLYFSADHGDQHHLHALPLAEQDETLIEGGLETLATGPEPIAHLYIDEFRNRRQVAFARGTCAAGFTTSTILRRRDVEPLRDVPGSVTPVGWLPDGRLVVAAREEGCDGPSDLYLWSEDGAELLVTDVDLAAIRAALPEPPDPPAPVGDQVVA